MSIATKPVSWTAYFIAGSTIRAEAEKAGRFILPEGLISHLSHLLKYIDRDFKVPEFVDRFIWYMVPHVPLQVALRKRFMFEEVKRAIYDEGAKQVIVFGAGLDCLCSLLATKYPDTLFVEVDHPATQATKIEAINNMWKDNNTSQPPNLHFLPVDFREEKVENVMSKRVKQWNNKSKTVGVSEGVFMYLTPEEVKSCFSSFKNIAGEDSQLCFQYQLDSLLKHRWLTPIRKLIFSVANEPMKWLPETLQAVDELVIEAGFDIDRTESRTDLYLRFVKPYESEIEFPANLDLGQFRNFVAVATLRS